MPVGQQWTFETNSLAGVDPVLYLFAHDGNGNLTLVTYDDDLQYPIDLDPSLTWTNNTQGTEFIVMLRAYSTGTSGTTEFKINGTVQEPNARVGGRMEPASSLTYVVGDDIRTVLRSGGSVLQVVVAFANQYDVLGVAGANGIGGAAILSAPANANYFFVATPHFLANGNLDTPRAGAVRLTANDAASDSDGDGLGDALERALGTCTGTEAALGACGGTTCCDPPTPNPADTDRDGINDFEEVYGVAGTLPDHEDDLVLARWGANPRHKDVFVEVDHLHDLRQATLSPPLAPFFPLGMNPFQWMQDNPGLALGNWQPGSKGWSSGTLDEWVGHIVGLYAVGPAAHLRNPDQQPGVSVHMDLGVQPLVDANEAVYGDYGPGSQRAVVEDFIIRVLSGFDGEVQIVLNGADATIDVSGLDAEQTCAAIALTSLVLILGNNLPVTLKQETCAIPGGRTIQLATQDESLYFSRNLLVAPVGAGSVVVERESPDQNYAHKTIGSIRRPNRRGLLRYAVLTEVTGGDGKAQSGADGMVSNLNPHTFAHELGHTCGVQHWGHNKWGTEGLDCIPQYDSIMNYVNGDTFSASDVPLTLNPSATKELQTLGAGYNYGRFSVSPFNYAVAGDRVDWNRDGVAENSQVAYRSFSLTANSRGCRSFIAGYTQLVAPTTMPSGVSDLVRFGDRIYALWPDSSSSLIVRSAQLGAVGNKGCTGSANPLDATGANPNPCLSFNPPTNVANLDDGAGVSAIVHDGQLWVASARGLGAGGSVEVLRFSRDAAGNLTLDAVDVTPVAGLCIPPNSAGNPSLCETTLLSPELVLRHTQAHGAVPCLLILARDGNFASFRWHGGQWVFEGPLLGSNGAPIAGTYPPIAKAWPDPDITWPSNEHRTLAILPGASGSVRLFQVDWWSGQWADIGFDSGGGQTRQKPFLEYKLRRSTSGTADANFTGNFLVGWMDPGDGENRSAFVRLSKSVDRLAPPGTHAGHKLGSEPLGDWLQNKSGTSPAGTAACLYSDATIDNVFGLLPIRPGLTEAGLNFLPHADASPGQPLSTHSDFRIMEDRICANIAGQRVPAFNCGVINVMD